MLPGRLLFAAHAAVFLSIVWPASGASPPTLADMAALRSITYLQASPDGQQVAYAMAGQVWIGAVRAGSAPKAIAKGNLPTWSEDSGGLTFYSSQTGSQQLWVADARSGKITQITNIAGGISPDPRTRQNGSVNDILRLSWSPDGEKIVFASRVESAAKTAGAAPAWQPADAAAGRPLVLTNDTPPAWTLTGVFTSAFGKPPELATSRSNRPQRKPG